jgi:L-seryl-tRNA(Ser) seleniumtransferase
VTREARGTIDGDAVRIRSEYPESLGDAINCTFTGRVTGDEMGGELDMGEYLKARWTAKRRAGGRG